MLLLALILSTHLASTPATHAEDPAPRPWAVVGRVLTVDGRPAAGAQIVLQRWCGGGGAMDLAATDRDGRFVVTIVPGCLEIFLELSISDTAGVQALRVDLPVLRTGDVVDVGDLFLEPARPILVAVRDAAGRPLPGAVVLSGTGRNELGFEDRLGRRALTDAAGLAVLPACPPHVTQVTVHALEHGSVTRHVAPGDAPPAAVDVCLDACPLLRLVIDRADGAAAAPSRIELAADDLLFRRATTWIPPFDRAWLGVPYSLGSRSGSDGSGWVRLGVSDRAVVSCLVPGVPFTLRVLGADGGALLERAEPALRPGERRELRLDVPRR